MSESAGALPKRLDDRARIRLAREGGVAYLPGLIRPREVVLATCSAAQKRAVHQALDQAQGHCCPPEKAGRGDQRYFRIVIVCPDEPSQERTLTVPEDQAPEALVRLWQEGP